MTNLPPMILEMIRLIGYAKAMELVKEFGGQELLITKNPGSESWAALTEVIGGGATEILAREFGGERGIYIAKCDAAIRANRNKEIIRRFNELTEKGQSVRKAVSVLVREFSMSSRRVEQIVNSPEPAAVELSAQMSLQLF